VAHGDEAVVGTKFRSVEREVEGVDGASVRPAAVDPHQMLPHEGSVVRGADASQEDSFAGSYPGREPVGRIFVASYDPGEGVGLRQDRLVHVVGASVARIGSHAGPFLMSGDTLISPV